MTEERLRHIESRYINGTRISGAAWMRELIAAVREGQKDTARLDALDRFLEGVERRQKSGIALSMVDEVSKRGGCSRASTIREAIDDAVSFLNER